jgi:hypothetical protein
MFNRGLLVGGVERWARPTRRQMCLGSDGRSSRSAASAPGRGGDGKLPAGTEASPATEQPANLCRLRGAESVVEEF